MEKFIDVLHRDQGHRLIEIEEAWRVERGERVAKEVEQGEGMTKDS